MRTKGSFTSVLVHTVFNFNSKLERDKTERDRTELE